MPTFADGESLSTVRTKINDAITKVDGVEAGADVTDTANVTAAGALMTTGGSVTGDVSFGDNNKAIFGNSADLQIYHSGSASFITEDGTGDLNIQGNNLVLEAPNGNNYLFATSGGAVSLFHNASTKLATTATGVDVTGTITSDELTVSGDSITIATSKTPASATDTGTAGEVAWDANYIYVCTATNTWVRAALATW